MGQDKENTVRIPIGSAGELEGDLQIPEGAKGVVIFAHGSGSSRHSPRNRFVASVLQAGGLGTLLIDLLTKGEGVEDEFSAHLRFNIGLLEERLSLVTRWFKASGKTLKVGYFGASTGAAGALCAAAKMGKEIAAVVSRGGRPDLAGGVLGSVTAPTLLIVGGHDGPVIGMNEEAFALLRCEKKMVIVPGATHLFEEPGALEQVARLAFDWFSTHFET